MALQYLTACPLCGNTSLKNFKTCIDYTYSREKFTISQCEHCSFLLTNPRPDSTDIGKYYQSENYISHTGKSYGIIDKIYRLARRYTLNWKLRQIKKYHPHGRLLDFGCGTGEFPHHMGENGWKVLGVEPSEAARNKASKLTGLPIAAELEEIKESAFEVITLWHVLEHLPDLNEKVDKLKSLLAYGGLIFVAVPNPESEDAKHYQDFWAGYDLPRHLWHFTPGTMNRLAAKHQLKIRMTVPMKLDVFYVSLLSEKYKNPGWINYPKAFFKGMESNFEARHNHNYSSLLYILGR